MDTAAAPVTVFFLLFACAGFGALCLHALGLLSRLPGRERWPMSVTLGLGLFGWLLFFPAVWGFVAAPVTILIVAAGILSLILVLRREPGILPFPQRCQPASLPLLFLLAVLAVAAVFDLMEAFAPPADADSLAYHFTIPKDALMNGRLEFVPRAVDGAVPLLLHMTYLAALSIAGEKAMTLWAGALGWLSAWMLYSVLRRFVSQAWSVAAAALWVTTPAVIYSGGSGHMEVKLASFVILAAVAAAECLRTGDLRFAALAGMAAGFFFASKYTGLLFVGAVGLTLIMQRSPVRAGIVCAATALIASWQWYFWNYLHTGDPLFPLLFEWLGAPPDMWSVEAAAILKRDYFPEENPAPRTVLLFFAYPLVATFNGLPLWESGRTGLGVAAVVLLPFALGWFWLRRQRLSYHPLWIFTAIAALFYATWFLSGSSQRIRHLVPLYPLVLIILVVGASRFASARGLAPILGSGLAAILVIQLAGHSVFALNYARYWFTKETREEFLSRNVARFAPVPWINRNLHATDKILVTERQLTYHILPSVYGAIQRYQQLVDLLPSHSNPARFYAQIRQQNITHILLFPSLADARQGASHVWTGELVSYTKALVDAGCAQTVHSTMTTAPASRTLPALSLSSVSSDVVAIAPTDCRIQ